MTEQAQEPQPASQEASASTEAKKAPKGFRTLLGIKRGMTQLFAEDGTLRAVTVVEAGPCTVLRVRTDGKDHYRAVQLGMGRIEEDRLNKPALGQFKALGMSPSRYVREIRVPDSNGFEPGQIVDILDRFSPLDYVDVQGVSKGRGFQGVMKRHGFRGMPGSHGASDKERSPGSLTARRSLGRVLPGQRMAGHTGHETVTVHKIEVVKTDPAKHLLYLNGCVPGPCGSLVVISETVKTKKRRIIRKVETVLRDKMGNIIKGKGAKARAAAEAKVAAESKSKAKPDAKTEKK